MRISDWSSDVCSSDLLDRRRAVAWQGVQCRPHRLHTVDLVAAPAKHTFRGPAEYGLRQGQVGLGLRIGIARGLARGKRSGEHPSELQSLMRITYAVFCLKKTTHKRNSTQTTPSSTTLITSCI